MFRKILVGAGEHPQSVMEAAERIAKLTPSTKIEHFHLDPKRPGDVLDDLLQHALDTGADLLVVGARRHVIASRAAMLAPCSVLMVPDEAHLEFERVLVPVDFSVASGEALRTGGALARVAEADLIALAVECDDDPWLDWEDDHGKIVDQLESFVSASGLRRGDVRCISEPVSRSTSALRDSVLSLPHRIEGADVAATIASVAAREAVSLIVMGTRGRTRSASILLGSVTEQTIQLAACPVLAVKHSGAHMGLVEAILERLRVPQHVVAS